MSDALTFAELKRITGEPVYVLDYAIRNYGPEPIARIGSARIWNRKQLPAIKASLSRTAANSKLSRRRGAATS